MMRQRALAIAAIAALTAVALAGCQPEEKKDAQAAPKTAGKAAQKASPSGYQARVLTAKELKAQQDQAELVIVDVRPAESFQREHIAGAINVPWSKLSSGHAQLPKDRFVALYCT